MTFCPDNVRTAYFFDLLTIVVFVLKPYRICDYRQEGWQSLVYCNGLENRRAFIGTVGSNPTPSANWYI